MKLKKFLSISIIYSIVVLFSNSTNAKTNQTIFENDKFFTENLKIYESTITDYIPFEIIYESYDAWCDNKIIDNTNKIVNNLSKNWDKKIKQSKYESTMNLRFDILKGMLSEIDKEKDKNLFCKKKLILYHLLDTTQELYLKKSNISLKNQNKKLFDSNNKNSINSHWSADTVKYITLTSNSNTLDKSELLFVSSAEKYIQNEIWKLLQRKFLNNSDIKTLNNKVFLHFNKTCENTKWSFHMLQSKDWKIKQFKSIELNINLCNKNTYMKNFENYIRQIFIHEISHYIYVFKDNSWDIFKSICWENWNTCNNEDFVSNYAKSSYAEDYAETLAYRYLDNFNWVDKWKWSAPTKKLWEKLSYFSNLDNRLRN